MLDSLTHSLSPSLFLPTFTMQYSKTGSGKGALIICQHWLKNTWMIDSGAGYGGRRHQEITHMYKVVFTMRWRKFSSLLPACNFGTAQLENLVPVSYCRATRTIQLWLNHENPYKMCHFLHEALFRARADSMNKRSHVFRLWDLNGKEVEELL